MQGVSPRIVETTIDPTAPTSYVLPNANSVGTLLIKLGYSLGKLSIQAVASYWNSYQYLQQRAAELKPSSIERLRHTADKLKATFGSDTPLDQITPDGAKDWRASMLLEGRAEATVRLHCRNAKSIFTDAVERELITRSPFAKLKSAAIAAVRDHYVTGEDAAKLVEACPNRQWRTLFGLMRYGGLRCPSETHGVTWRDVDWEKKRLTVYAPKTDKTRVVPIVSALMPILQDAFDAAAEGADKIITLSKNNMHRNFHGIISKASLVAWPDLFQTLRRSCETDLARTCRQCVDRPLDESVGKVLLAADR